MTQERGWFEIERERGPTLKGGGNVEANKVGRG
jgi:hypothetical protein